VLRQGLFVTDYVDRPVGEMIETTDGGGGRFTEVVLLPATVKPGSDLALAEQLHKSSSPVLRTETQ